MDINNILEELQKVRQGKGSPLTLVDLSFIIDIILHSKAATSQKYSQLTQELSKLHDSFHNSINAQNMLLKQTDEVNKLLQSNEDDLQDMGKVLAMSAYGILDALQKYIDSSTKDEKTSQALIEEVSEKCCFHDLVGQRITRISKNIEKFSNIMQEYESNVIGKKSVCSVPIKSSNENLMNGPARVGKGLNQQDVDAIFKSSKTKR